MNPINKILYTIAIIVLLSETVFSQNSYPTTIQKDLEYTVSPQSESTNLYATKSITLKPNVWLKSGSNVKAQIRDAEEKPSLTQTELYAMAESMGGLYSNGVTDTQGELNISNSGNSTYKLPIALPPSIQNLGPTINLIYSSGQIGGVAGMGWNISGLSVIQRISTRKDIDNENRGVNFDITDKLALDGQRLILKTGEYWQDGSTYETEIQSNTKIELKGSGTNLSVIVTTADGMRYWYGKNLWGGTDGYSVSAYYIVRQEDVNGNYILYNYIKPNKNGVSTNTLYIDEIQFSANKNQASAPINTIKFNYDDAKREEVAYINQLKVIKDKTLKNIEVLTNSKLFRKYDLKHTVDALNGYETVTEIQESNGSGKTANPVVFKYDTTEDKLFHTVEKCLYVNYLNYEEIKFSGDFDGDGKLDFVSNNNYLHSGLFADFTASNAIIPLSTDEYVEYAATTAKDGIVNQHQSLVALKIINSVNSEFQIYDIVNGKVELSYKKPFPLDFRVIPVLEVLKQDGEAYGCNFDFATTKIWKSKPIVLPGDFNGDGITEMIFSIDKTTPITLKATTNGCTTGKTGKVASSCCELVPTQEIQKEHFILDLNQSVSTAFGYEGYLKIDDPLNLMHPNIKKHLGDFNGNGITDIFFIDVYGNYTIAEILRETNLARLNIIGKGFIENYYLSEKIILGDFNGDGKTDFITPYFHLTSWWTIYTSNPKNTFSNTTEIFEKQLHYIVPFLSEKIPSSDSYSYYAMDVNKDGKSDIVMTWTNSDKRPKTFNNIDTTWIVQTYINRIGFKGEGSTPSTFFPSNMSWLYDYSFSEEIPKFIIAPYDYRGMSSEIFVVRNTTQELARINFSKDVSRDATLTKVMSSGGQIVSEIEYAPLAPKNAKTGNGALNDPIYSISGKMVFPNVEIQRLPTMKVVSRLKNTSLGITKYQDFRYHGYTVNMRGLGVLGFNKIARSEWYQDENTIRKWNVTENDPLLRGMTARTYVQLLNGTNFTFYPLTEDADKIPDLISCSTNLYYQRYIGKVYSLVLNVKTFKDYLNDIKKETVLFYDGTYNHVVKNITQTYLGSSLQSKSTETTEYENNPSGAEQNYYIGRIKSTQTTTEAYDDTQKSEAKYTYDKNQVIKIQTKANNADNIYITKDYQYDTFGNVKKETTSVPGAIPSVTPRTTQYTYDLTGRFVKTVTNNLGETTTNDSYHPLYGLVTQQTGNNPKHIQKSVYNSWGDLVETEDYLGNKTLFIKTRNGSEISTTKISQDGSQSKITANIVGQIVTKAEMDQNGRWNKISYKYDFQGEKTKESEPYQESPTLWNETKSNIYGQIIEQRLATGKTIIYDYKGLTMTVDDGIKITSVITNANGHKISSTDPGGTITYTYNANGQLKTSTYAGVTQSVTYDDWGRKIKLVDPSAGEYTYKYNAFGETLQENTPLGTTIYTLDNYGRIQRKQNAGSGVGVTSDYSYDPKTNLLAKITESSEGQTSQYEFTYDSFERPINKTENTPNVQFSQEITYDDFGRLYKETKKATLKVNNKTQTTSTRSIYKNGYNYILKNNLTGEILWSNNQYNARGQLTEGTFGNGIKLSNSYDSYGFPVTISHGEQGGIPDPSTAGENNDYKFVLSYTFNPITGNLDNRKTQGKYSQTEVFTYDNQDRLRTSTLNGIMQSYTIDNQGRITNTSKTGDYRYSNTSKPFQLTAITLNAAQQDPDITNTQEITYNAFKSPIRIHQKNKETLFFSYNGFEQRNIQYYGDLQEDKLKKKLRKYYSQDGSTEIIFDTQTGTSTFFTYIGGDAYSAPLVIKGNGDTQANLYLHRDYQGSILSITDQNKSVIEFRLFDAWGNTTIIKDGQGNNLTKLTVLDRGYTGHEHLQGVALIHMNGRLYDAKLHRFLGPDNYVHDPTNTQSYNRYAYVFNNPLKYTDTSGESPELVAIAIAVGVAIVAYTANAYFGHSMFTTEGLVQTAFIAAISSIATMGVGAAVQGINQFAAAGIQAVAHGTIQGVSSEMMGGKFISGFASGAISSLVASAFQFDYNGKCEEGLGWASGFRSSKEGAIAFATVSGGVASELTGGNFWMGAAQGFMVAFLNHTFEHGDPDPEEKLNVVEDYFDYNGDGKIGPFEMALGVADVGMTIFDIATIPSGEAVAAHLAIGAFAKRVVPSAAKTTGWISRNVYSKLDPAIRTKFVQAIGKGVVAPTGKQGIVKLTASEAQSLGSKYSYKLKILGKGGDLRIYGNQLDNGHFVFSHITGH